MFIQPGPNVSLILIAVLAMSCQSGDESPLDKSDNNRTINIGHAGSGFNYLLNPFNPLPANSFASLKKALDNGAEGVEIDLQITSDNVLVLFHDITLESQTALSGTVASITSDVIIGAPYHCGFPYDLFHDEHVISFRDWIEYAVSLHPVPFLQIDVKYINDQTETMKDSLIAQMMSQLHEVNYPLEKVIAISVEQPLILKMIHNYSDLSCAYESADFIQGLEWAHANKVKFMVTDVKKLTSENVQLAREKNIGVIAFGGKSKSTLSKVLNMNPDFIQSNNVKLVTKLLE